MAGSGVATPAELKILSEAVDNYCRAHEIMTSTGRESVALQVLGSFQDGVDDAVGLAAALERDDGFDPSRVP
ncbi:hypothetical protein [Amaricoccus solimangrovi]|uniref:Uncharacterized protein n=1 Tax=Amaricoccus solimangrovi TaxID=2589815 RepID=A0A501WPF7_9RHOB|nr:hypothetical protein [Amaricoccus solimangrovi]TPE51643.1 hypothetical protein FJM51_08040 [Amaricoccus solimangrovi]